MPPELGPPPELVWQWTIAIWAALLAMPCIAAVALAWGEPARRRYDAAPRGALTAAARRQRRRT